MKRLVKNIRLHAAEGKGVSNVLLDRIARLVCTKSFRGVFAANKIPRILAARPRFIIIVNLGVKSPGKTKLPVGHFVCISARPDEIDYVDPYGMPCLQPDVLGFLTDCGRHVRENKRQIQHMDSPYCSLFSLLYAIYFDKGDSNFKMKFNKQRLKANDKKCMQYLIAIIKRD